eukprot:m.236670 g.236670  ORF g.236670 m.236670 type:complete len:95 (+) comp13923_c1_seq16:1432-1716(+)
MNDIVCCQIFHSLTRLQSPFEFNFKRSIIVVTEVRSDCPISAQVHEDEILRRSEVVSKETLYSQKHARVHSHVQQSVLLEKTKRFRVGHRCSHV